MARINHPADPNSYELSSLTSTELGGAIKVARKVARARGATLGPTRELRDTLTLLANAAEQSVEARIEQACENGLEVRFHKGSVGPYAEVGEPRSLKVEANAIAASYAEALKLALGVSAEHSLGEGE